MSSVSVVIYICIYFLFELITRHTLTISQTLNFMIMNHQKSIIKKCNVPYTSFQNTPDWEAKSNESTNSVTMKNLKPQEDLALNVEYDNMTMPVSILPSMTKYPTIANCTICNSTVETIVERRINRRGLSWAIFCIFGCFLFSFLTRCFDSFNDWIHTCPNCKGIIGKHSPCDPSLGEIVILVIASLVGVVGFGGLLVGLGYLGWVIAISTGLARM